MQFLTIALTESLRFLGYPTVVPLDGFRAPNFSLLVSLLNWLLKCYDPEFNIKRKEIETEQDRVDFVKNVSLYLVSKAQVKLNTIKLYSADGNAVKELLKVIQLFSNSPTVAQKIIPREDSVLKPRELADTITVRGAALYELLHKEANGREMRQAAIAKPIDLPAVKEFIDERMQKITQEMVLLQNSLQQLVQDRDALNGKVEARNLEIKRREKRLKSLQVVRPAYMDEYEKLEVELKKLYKQYVDKSRNLAYLEQQADEYSRLEHIKGEEADLQLKRIQQKMKDDELNLLKYGDVGGSMEDYEDSENLSIQDPEESGREDVDFSNSESSSLEESLRDTFKARPKGARSGGNARDRRLGAYSHAQLNDDSSDGIEEIVGIAPQELKRPVQGAKAAEMPDLEDFFSSEEENVINREDSRPETVDSFTV